MNIKMDKLTEMKKKSADFRACIELEKKNYLAGKRPQNIDAFEIALQELKHGLFPR